MGSFCTVNIKAPGPGHGGTIDHAFKSWEQLPPYRCESCYGLAAARTHARSVNAQHSWHCC
jgi:hypothetical protein